MADPLEACSPKATEASKAAAAEATLPYAVLAARGTCPFGPKSANVAAAYVGCHLH